MSDTAIIVAMVVLAITAVVIAVIISVEEDIVERKYGNGHETGFRTVARNGEHQQNDRKDHGG